MAKKLSPLSVNTAPECSLTAAPVQSPTQIEQELSPAPNIQVARHGPVALLPREIAHLQRSIGNQAVRGLLVRSERPLQRTPEEEIGAQANIGVELELRNITITRGDRNWDNDAGLEQLTTGGVDGNLVSDQHQGKSAIIEWSSDHPAMSTTENAKKFQDKVKKVNAKLKSKMTGKLPELIEATKDVFKVGTVEDEHKDVKYTYNSSKATQTQINLELPFENIGQDPKDKLNAASNPERLFTGDSPGSKNAAKAFKESRSAANHLAADMVKGYNDVYTPNIVSDAATVSLASLLTIFFHTEVNDATGGGKDAQGVLFKSGAGDLARTALNDEGKKVLWVYAHNTDLDNVLAETALGIYKKVYGDRGGSKRAQKILANIRQQAAASFIRGGTSEDEQALRYGNETTGYGSTVDEDWFKQDGHAVREAALDPNKDAEFINTRYLSGVKTGKQFDVATHSSTDGSVSSKYLIAEIRRNDNEINKLVGPDISATERKRIGEKVKALQKPIS